MARHKNKGKRGKKPDVENTLSVAIHGSVLQKIRLHARSTPQMEICGVLLGGQTDGQTRVIGAIKGEGAAQGDAHVTFTQETWVKIHEEKDAKYPDEKIVGWYHSHPGFGVFLSDHDLFIHKNFFSQPSQLAWVFDPHSDEEGCFGWENDEVRRVKRIEVVSDVETEPLDRTEPAIVSTATDPLSADSQPVSFWRELSRDLMLIASGGLLGVVMAFMWLPGAQPASTGYVMSRVGKLQPFSVPLSNGQRVIYAPLLDSSPTGHQEPNLLMDRLMNPAKTGTPPTADDASKQTGERDEQPERQDPDHLE